MPGTRSNGVAATARLSRQSNSIEFVIAACVLIAALLLAAVERTGNTADQHRATGAVQAPAATASSTSADQLSARGSLTIDPQDSPAQQSLGSLPAATAVVPASGGTAGLAATTTSAAEIQAQLAPELEVIGRSALGRIGYPWQWLGYEITFAPGRDGLHALTFPYERRIEIYVRDDDSVAGLAHVIAHEIGHAIDVELSDGDQRRAWLRSRGLAEDYPWWPGNGLNDFSVGAGDFAECFAQWDLGSESLSRLPGNCEDSVDVLESIIHS